MAVPAFRSSGVFTLSDQQDFMKPKPIDTQAKDQEFTRWSAQRYIQDKVNTPVYVPSELFWKAKGQAMKIFQIRALLNDMNRMGEDKNFEDYFRKKRARSPEPVYNTKGERTNTRERRFRDLKMKLVQDLLNMSNLHHNRVTQIQKQKFQKCIYFTPEFLETTSFRIIIGPRGRTQKELEAETGAIIHVLGKGTGTRRVGKPQPGDDDDPHILITAATEEILHKAVDRINFILSDTPEAQAWKAQKLRELSIINGTFRDMPNFPMPGPSPASSSAKPQDGIFSKDIDKVDDEYADFMKELLEDEDTKAAAVTAQAVEKEVVSKEKALKAAQDKAVSEAIKIALTCKTPAAEPSAAGPRGVFPRPPPRAPPGVAPMGGPGMPRPPMTGPYGMGHMHQHMAYGRPGMPPPMRMPPYPMSPYPPYHMHYMASYHQYRPPMPSPGMGPRPGEAPPPGGPGYGSAP
eukprot:EG_transcript_12083